MAEALQQEIERKKKILNDLNSSNADAQIKNKLNELESLTKENTNLQEVLYIF